MTTANNPRIALLWVHFGPYHLARLRALRRQCAVTAIEFASGQEMYGWRSDMNSEVTTLGGTVYEHAGSSQTIRRLWRILDETRPDVLLIPGYREPLSVIAAVWGRLHGRTNVLMFDSTVFDQPRSSLKEKVKAVLTQGLFHKAFVSGKRSASYLQSLSRRPLPFEKGYDAVDNSYFARRICEIRAGREGDRLPGVFLFVGRLVAAKGLSLLLNAFATYRHRGGLRKLEIVGHGPLENSLKTTAIQAGIEEYVRFQGFQPYEALPECYSHAGCLILPSVSEPWGLVVNEAMASGLPVVVSDRCGCVDDLVEDGRNGFIFQALSTEALVGRMLAIDALTEENRKAMGRRSQEIISRYSPETWADAVLRLAQGQSACSAAA